MQLVGENEHVASKGNCEQDSETIWAEPEILVAVTVALATAVPELGFVTVSALGDRDRK
jgi:hypothetical protein